MHLQWDGMGDSQASKAREELEELPGFKTCMSAESDSKSDSHSDSKSDCEIRFEKQFLPSKNPSTQKMILITSKAKKEKMKGKENRKTEKREGEERRMERR